MLAFELSCFFDFEIANHIRRSVAIATVESALAGENAA